MKRLLFTLAMIALLLGTFSPAVAYPASAAPAPKKEKRIAFKITGKITRFKQKSVVMYVLSSEKGADAYVGRTVTLAITGQTIITVRTDNKKKPAPFRSLKTSDILTVKGNIRPDGLFVATYIVLDKRTKK